jgi:hypothetical protein
VTHGVEIGRRLLAEAARRAPEAPALGDVVIGIEASHDSPLVSALTERALAAGATVVAGESAHAPVAAGALAAFGGAVPPGAVTTLTGAGRGAQQHVALALAGAHVIVAFPLLDDAPVGFPVCPVIAVAGDSALHAALAEDFDLPADAGAGALWSLVLAVLAGAETAAESRGSRVFALERLAMSM